jgi:peroxin-6
MLKAMTRVADSIEEKVKNLNEEKRPDLPDPLTAQYYLSHLVTPEEIAVQVEEVDFIKALDELIPSVSATELAHYSKVREKFEKPVEEDNEEQIEEVPLEEINTATEEEIKAALLEAQRLEEEKLRASVKNKSKGKGKQRAN